jgi:hypothetical protein
MREWVQLELWTNDDDSVGWQIMDHLNPSLKLKEFQSALLEMTEWALDMESGNPVDFSFFMHRDGQNHTRPNLHYDFSNFRVYLSLRGNFYRGARYALGWETGTPYLHFVWWSLEWVWYKVTGQFKRSQKALEALATPAAAAPADIVSEASEGSQNTCAGGTSNVTPISAARSIRKVRDDRRPL